MRILFTVASYYPTPGGVQMVTQYTAEELVKYGHEVTVLTSNYDCKSPIREHNGVKIIYCDLYKWMDFTFGDKNAYLKQLQTLSNQIDVLITVSLQTPTTDLAMRIIDHMHCKKVLYLHDIYDFKWHECDFYCISSFIKKLYYNTTRRIYYSYIYKYIRKYDLVTHLSPFDISMNYVKRHKIKQNLVIGNAALDSVFHCGKSTTTKLSPYFICIANYNDNKNQKKILEAFYKTKINSEIKLIFVGKEKNKYYSSLVKHKQVLDKYNGIRNVDFLVGVSREKTEILLSNATALLLGSKIEKFPVVIIEAMASGIPFISSDVGCVRYQPGGFIVRDSEEMAYWMDFILDNPIVASKYGEAAYQYALKNMTVNSKVELLINAINNIHK